MQCEIMIDETNLMSCICSQNRKRVILKKTHIARPLPTVQFVEVALYIKLTLTYVQNIQSIKCSEHTEELMFKLHLTNCAEPTLHTIMCFTSCAPKEADFSSGY